jgi:hypothetical protein
MPRLIVPQFAQFSAEGEIIGRLTSGYGSLESALSSCVAMGRDDLDMVIKAMFRARGETQRIDIADAMGRPAYKTLGFAGMFSEAIADMRFCLKVRNQFSHCQWHIAAHRLCFVDMEEIAKEHPIITNFDNLTFHYLDLETLTRQEAYFVYVGDCLLYMNYEGRKLRGQFPSHALVKPKKAARPPLFLP